MGAYSHVGVESNERADEAAEVASRSSNIRRLKVEANDIKPQIKDNAISPIYNELHLQRTAPKRLLATHYTYTANPDVII